jgi:hypothetical protein
MAFRKLEGCDMSDMNLWAKSLPAQNFIKEVNERRAKALRALIKCGNEENAAIVRAYDFVSRLFDEARTGK